MPTSTPTSLMVVTVCFAPGNTADWFTASEKVDEHLGESGTPQRRFRVRHRRLVGAFTRFFGYQLVDAARRFDAARGVPFRAYANFRVRGAVIDGIRATARLPRRVHERLRALDDARLVSESAAEDTLAAPAPPGSPADAERALSAHLASMATAMAIGLVAEAGRGEEGELTSVDTGSTPEEALADAELLGRVRVAIETLPKEEAELVRRHYLEGERFDRVATDLGLSKSWASRLHTRAIGRLTKRLRGITD